VSSLHLPQSSDTNHLLPQDRIVSYIPVAPTSSSLPRPLCFKLSIFLRRKKESMNSIDQELFEATRENNPAEVSRLLRAGAGVNAKNDNGFTPLHWSWKNGQSQVLIELLDHGADIEVKDRNGLTPLHYACASGNVAVIVELLSRGAVTEVRDDRGDTPLHDASGRGHLPVVKALLNGGADILATNNQGNKPIHYAVRKRKAEVSKYLLREFYATIRLPLHELLKDLTWIGDPNSNILDFSPLFTSVRHNVLGTDDVVEILEYLVDQNPDSLASRDQDRSLPLHVACRRGASFPIVQSLVNLYKASVKSVTSKGDLPLFLACETPEPSLDTLCLLIKLYPDLVYR
jgi:ankyrin repeat protein